MVHVFLLLVYLGEPRKLISGDMYFYSRLSVIGSPPTLPAVRQLLVLLSDG